MKDLYERVLPALDDEFAKDQGEFQNLEELRTAIHKDLQSRALEQAEGRARQGLIDLIIERNPVEVPESLLAREERLIEAETAAALEAAGMPRESALERARQNPEEIKTRAEKRAKSALIVDAIAEQEKIEVSDDDVANRVATIVTQSGQQRERAAEFYAHEENRVGLKAMMRREKTLDLMLSRAQSEDAAAATGETPAGEAPAGA